MHSYGYLISAILVICELGIFLTFLFEFRRLRLGKAGNSEKTLKLYAMTKLVMGLAIAYPTLLLVVTLSMDAVNIFNVIFYLLAFGPVAIEWSMIKKLARRP